MIIYTEKEIRASIRFNRELINIVEDAFTLLSKNKVVMPPIMRVDIKENYGEVDVKTAYILGEDTFAIKVSSGFFNNYKLGLPSGNGFMVLMSTLTGEPEAFLLDNGYLTELRTAAAGAVAANHMAKKNVSTVGVIGTGTQAKFQMSALKSVRNYKEILVFGRSIENMKAYQKEMEAALDVLVTIASSPEQVVRESEIVVTTTPSSEPIIKSEWLHPGLHITAMGSDAENKQELEADIFNTVDRYVCDIQTQCAKLGELHHMLKLGVTISEEKVIELGDVTSGRVKGRLNNNEITVCDLTGTGVQDTAIAIHAYKLLKLLASNGMHIDNKKGSILL